MFNSCWKVYIYREFCSESALWSSRALCLLTYIGGLCDPSTSPPGLVEGIKLGGDGLSPCIMYFINCSFILGFRSPYADPRRTRGPGVLGLSANNMCHRRLYLSWHCGLFFTCTLCMPCSSWSLVLQAGLLLAIKRGTVCLPTMGAFHRSQV